MSDIDEQIRIAKEQAHMWAEEVRTIDEAAKKRIAESDERIRQSKERLRKMLKVRYDPKDFNRNRS